MFRRQMVNLCSNNKYVQSANVKHGNYSTLLSSVIFTKNSCLLKSQIPIEIVWSFMCCVSMWNENGLINGWEHSGEPSGFT